MAKYGDYANAAPVHELDAEIEEAASNQRARDEKGRFIPDRFKDKDITDVIKSYEELEKLNSRQAQDLGAMRKTVDQLMQAQLQQSSSPAQETSKPVSVDDLYEDADGVLRRVVKETTSGEIAELKAELQSLRAERKLAELEKKFKGWREKAQTPEFQNWVQQSAYRMRMIQEADQGDFDAAEEILGMYYDTLSEEEDKKERPADRAVQLRDAMLESTSPQLADTDETYSRSDLLEARLAAKRGDLKAERWLKAHADSIAAAYESGRIVD